MSTNNDNNNNNNFIDAIVEGPERQVGEEDIDIFETEFIKIKVPTTGGKYVDKVYPLTPEAYELLRESLKKRRYLPQFPILINRQGDVLDGHHRLKLCLELHITPTFQLKEGFSNEIEEELFVIDINLARRQLSKFQRLELALRKEPLYAEQARRNMKAGVTLSRNQERVHTDEKIAKDAKSNKDAVYKAKKIVNSQLFKENEDFREKVRTDKIGVEHAYTQAMRAADRDIPKPKPPEGEYDVILADPPWNYYNGAVRGSPEAHYAVMTDDELKALKIPAADNSVLYMWATMPKLKEALSVMETWGFDYKTGAGWEKDRIGTGYYFRGQFELLLLGVKGKGLGVPAEANRPSSVIHAPRTEHSKKPSEVYEMIESMFPKRKYIELFARGSDKREGWKTWGLEAAV